MSLQTRLRPWHAVLVAVFLVGTGLSLFRAGDYAFADWFEAVVSGLLALLVFQFTVGNLWGYAVEYYNAGGEWTDPVFLAPFAVATLVGIAVGVWSESLATAAWGAFWVFVVAAGVVAAGAWFVVGYRRPDA
ncbi:hypothetical protein SAMN04487948_109108 [Halogranum amylolyticum]|uniref:Uncharacterized protein n=1 Tax=Halogranum amylolyticum TaxID=660520 RepID=A0A1H8U3L2_9EURY|nr:hypothetical protein [Halogranum amylolyticum]SEO97656.1 hypothetical protein SAMN04487948_109108 [Halogranum amylolyticum]